jgi:hypothetical protein
MEVECLKPSSCLGDCRSSCHRRTLGTAALAVVAPWGPPLVLPSPCLGTTALAVVAPWGPPLLSSPRLGDYRSSCRRRCCARRRPTPSPRREEAITASDGGHRRRCPAAHYGGTVVVPEVVEEAALKHHAASGVEEGGRALKRKVEAAPSRGRLTSSLSICSLPR